MSDVDAYPRHYAYPLVTWDATILGTLVALVTSLMINLLGAALGIAAAVIGQSSSAVAGAGVIGVVWVAVANLVALGFGAGVAARATANPDHHGGTLQGIAVWALTSCAVLFIATSALSGIEGAAMQAANIAATASSSVVPQEGAPSNAQAQRDAQNAQASLQANAPATQSGAVKAVGGCGRSLRHLPRHSPWLSGRNRRCTCWRTPSDLGRPTALHVCGATSRPHRRRLISERRRGLWAPSARGLTAPLPSVRRGAFNKEETIMAKAAHTEAAEHHEKAAKSHRTAAEHHDKGDHAAATKHSIEAHDHSTKAHESSAKAHAKSGAAK